MNLKPNERRDLKKSYKRLGWFLLAMILIDGFIAFLLYYYLPHINEVLCGFIIIVVTTGLYLLYLWICSKLDKRKAQRLERSGEKDPFTRN